MDEGCHIRYLHISVLAVWFQSPATVQILMYETAFPKVTIIESFIITVALNKGKNGRFTKQACSQNDKASVKCFFWPTSEATRFAEEHCYKADESNLDAHRRACRSHSSNGRDPLESSEGPQGKKKGEGVSHATISMIWRYVSSRWKCWTCYRLHCKHTYKTLRLGRNYFPSGWSSDFLMFDVYHYDWSLTCINRIYKVDILISHISVY